MTMKPSEEVLELSRHLDATVKTAADALVREAAAVAERDALAAYADGLREALKRIQYWQAEDEPDSCVCLERSEEARIALSTAPPAALEALKKKTTD